MVRTGVDKGPVAGYEAEAQGFGELAMTPQSKGLIGLFRGQTECKKNRFGKSQVDVKNVCFFIYLFNYSKNKICSYETTSCLPKKNFLSNTKKN